MITEKLEITIKISELPQAKTLENSLQQLNVDCGGRIISLTVKPKVWNKLTDGASNYPQWVGASAGKLGQQTEQGFVSKQLSIQVFERKPKVETIATADAA